MKQHEVLNSKIFRFMLKINKLDFEIKFDLPYVVLKISIEIRKHSITVF